jgi:NAD(P)-dependent dehydrogenase (short-subunit alcohol dehydrogenase family)
MGKLDGKIALVTGGNSGIGFATAKLFIAEGAHVYITGRRQDKLDEAVNKLGAHATGVQGDVASVADLDRLYAQIKKEKGALHVVFANAGAAELVPLELVDEAHFDRMFNGNVKGLLFTVQKALPLLSKGASVILCSSVVGSKGFPANSVYAATKAAIRSFARTLTTDLKGRGIRVNAVSPGPIDTEGFNALIGTSEEGQARKAGFSQMVALGRVGRPEEIANAVLFLASDDSSYMAGAELFVDGGMGQV